MLARPFIFSGGSWLEAARGRSRGEAGAGCWPSSSDASEMEPPPALPPSSSGTLGGEAGATTGAGGSERACEGVEADTGVLRGVMSRGVRSPLRGLGGMVTCGVRGVGSMKEEETGVTLPSLFFFVFSLSSAVDVSLPADSLMTDWRLLGFTALVGFEPIVTV